MVYYVVFTGEGWICMLGNFFNSFYYGKAGKGDYNPENLPANRRQLFFEMLRVRWSALVRLNLLYLLFLLPALIWTGWSYLALTSAVLGPDVAVVDSAEPGAVQESAAAGEAVAADAVAQSNAVRSTIILWLAILCPCIAITGPFTAGVSYVTRNWARDQHSFMLSDFKDAVKENWKQALGVSCITGVLPLLVYISYSFYGEMAATRGVFFIIPQMLIVILGLIWLLSLQLVYTLMVTYRLSFRHLIRNAIVLSVGKLPLSLGIRLLSWVFPALCLGVMLVFPEATAYAFLALILYYSLFGFAFNRFLYASYANALCEKYINVNIEGAPTNMGLRQVDEDSYEIDPTVPQPRPDDDDE